MKRISLLIIAMVTCIASITAQSEADTVQQTAVQNGIEYVDIPDSDNTGNAAKQATLVVKDQQKNDFFSSDLGKNKEALLIPIIAIIAVFSVPILIVFFNLYFKYKNKKAKYDLVQKALEAGQPLPENFFQDKANSNVLTKGITNVFTGIGLFLFLWFITNEFGLGCIGLMVMFTGFGQIVIHYTQQRNSKKDTDNDNNCPNTQE